MHVGTKPNRLDILVHLSILALLLAVPLTANAQEWDWAHQGEGLFSDDGRGIAFDADDNTLVTGSFGSGGGGTITFDPVILASAGNSDCFVVKYSPEGDVLWAHSGGGTRSDGFSDLAVDAVGNTYVTGAFGQFASPGETATFGSETIVSAGDLDMSLVKYSPEGEVLWARSGGGTERDEGSANAIDSSGNIFVTGFYYGTATFGPFTLTSSGNRDIFLVKYSPEGDVLWAQSAGGGGDVDRAKSVALDEDGNAFITGFFEGTIGFGPFSLTNTGSADCYLAKYSPDGAVLWARATGGDAHELCYGVAITADGSAFLTGRFAGSMVFGASTIDSASNDSFVVKYSSEGEALWAQNGGGVLHDEAQDIAVDGVGDAYITGYFSATATFGPFVLTSSDGDWDVFIVKYSQDGETLWAQSGGGINGEWSYGIAISTSGELGIVGNFEEIAEFGPHTLEATGSPGAWDMFVAKHGPPVVPIEPVAGPAEELVLSSVYPNPFASTGRFTLAVPEAQHVTIEVLDLLGRQVALLHNAFLPANQAHSFVIEAGGLPSGLYTVRATGEHFSAVRRIVLVR